MKKKLTICCLLLAAIPATRRYSGEPRTYLL